MLTLSKVEILLNDGKSVVCDEPDSNIVEILEDAMRPEKVNSVILLNLGNGRTATVKCANVTGYKLHPKTSFTPESRPDVDASNLSLTEIAQSFDMLALSIDEQTIVAAYRAASIAIKQATKRMLGVPEE